MTTITDTSPLRHTRSYTITPKFRIRGDLATSTVTTMAPAMKNPHENSAASSNQDFPRRIQNPEQRFQTFSTSLLKNKGLLVPTRLALKRQRASLKAPSTKFEPVHSDILQMELGNPEELLLHNDRDDEDHTSMVTRGTHLLPEQNRMQSTSNQTSTVRGDTPHTAPTDISLLYRYVKNNCFFYFSILSFDFSQIDFLG
jgi:hypothetical protein